ncbi:hypothetical protein GFV15_00020 [Lactococcus lactis]|uniref:plasmid mobilization protein n=1 Tax=Lactococcus lactis TaxID=1358 RepID=UPI001293536A|nr:hypothetical protein [Lactococcus lactis]MQQ79380.1 hypothetical protein [Lactococcus lactis]
MKNKNIIFRVTEEEKDYISKKSSENGFNSISAFIMDCINNKISFEVDMKVYKQIAKEINYIGRNINQIIRSINAKKYYTENELKDINMNLEKIYELESKEFSRLSKLKFNVNNSSSVNRTLKKIIHDYEQASLPVPKAKLLKEVYKELREDFIFIIELIKDSKEIDDDLATYFIDSVLAGNVEKIEEGELISFYDEFELFSENIRIKTIDINYNFSENDWFKMKDILEKYNIF